MVHFIKSRQCRWIDVIELLFILDQTFSMTVMFVIVRNHGILGRYKNAESFPVLLQASWLNSLPFVRDLVTKSG